MPMFVLSPDRAWQRLTFATELTQERLQLLPRMGMGILASQNDSARHEHLVQDHRNVKGNSPEHERRRSSPLHPKTTRTGVHASRGSLSSQAVTEVAVLENMQ